MIHKEGSGVSNKQQQQECSLSIIVLSLQNNNEKQTTSFVSYQEDSLIVNPHIG